MATQTIQLSGSYSLDMAGINMLVVLLNPVSAPVSLNLDNFVLGNYFQLVVWNQSPTVQFKLTATDIHAVNVTVYMHSGGTLTDISDNFITLPMATIYSLVGGLVLPSPGATTPVLFLALI